MPKYSLLSGVLTLALLMLTSGCQPVNQAETRAVLSGADSGVIQSGKFNLEYRIEGSGPPAIIIGLPNYNSRVFSRNLRSHLQMIFVDHRGSAKSPGPVDVSEFSLDRLVDDLELVRTTLGLGRVVAIGHSGNSYMALEYAKKYPASVSHVVMIGIAPDLSDASTQAADQYWQKVASPERKAALEANTRRITDEHLAQLPPDEAFVQNYVRRGPRIWYDPHFDPTPLFEGVEINMQMVNHVWGKLFKEIDITRGLDDLDRPVFLALGHYDCIVAPPSSWDPITPLFKDVTVRVFEKSGHTPQYEEPELFDEELMSWIRSHE
jgi:pimeloyl-ACP methyl ester carboxylesterase